MTMRLGTQTGSLMNHLMSGTLGAAPPTVGEGCTFLHWTDRSAGTVVKVSPSGKTAWVRADKAIRTDTHGMSDSQSYRYEAIPDAPLTAVRLGKRGWRTSGGTTVAFGYRRAYHDYSF
jgi:hypothetical protein